MALSRGTKADQFSYVPVGTVLPFAGGTAPEGWALCDGATKSRTDFPELYSAIGNAWGEGDGSTTFHLPDLRGSFLRGTDNMSGIPGEEAGRDSDAGTRTPANAGGNSGNAVGTFQNHEVQNHGHSGNGVSRGGNGGTGRTLAVGDASNFGTYTPSVQSFGGNESRPINININYIIKL